MRNYFGTQALAVGLLLAVPTLGTAQEKPAGGPSEGIKVHGHWTIEVRNPDGSLASSRDFENSLDAVGGPRLLSEILGRVTPALPWRIYVPVLLCKDSFGAAEWCHVVEPDSTYPTSPDYFPNLTLTVMGNGTLELRGSFTAEFAGAISWLATTMQSTIFSFKALAAPVPVSAGQIVQLKVVFSFS